MAGPAVEGNGKTAFYFVAVSNFCKDTGAGLGKLPSILRCMETIL